MDKTTFLNKVEAIINQSDYKSLQGNYDERPKVIFKDDSGVSCVIEFDYRIFGLISYITLRRDYIEVLKFKITKDEFKKLKKCVGDKIKQIKDQELGMVFKDITRDNNIKSVLDGK